MRGNQKDEKSPELRAFEAAIQEYRASRGFFWVNSKRRSRAEAAFKEAQEAYIQSLPDDHFLDEENMKAYIEELTKDIYVSNYEAYGKLEKAYDRLGKNKDAVSLQQDLYELQRLKNRYISVKSDLKRNRRLESDTKADLIGINTSFHSIASKILANETLLSNSRNKEKFEDICDEYLGNIDGSKGIESELYFLKVYNKERSKAIGDRNDERLAYFETKLEEFEDCKRSLDSPIHSKPLDKQQQKRYTAVCDFKDNLEQNTSVVRGRDLGALAQSPKQREGSRSALSRQSSSSSIDSDTPLLAAEGGARHSSSRVGRKTRQKL